MSYITDRNYDPKGDTADFDRLYAINVRGTFFCYKYAAIQMVSQGRGGRIIGASSLAGKKGQSCLKMRCETYLLTVGTRSQLLRWVQFNKICYPWHDAERRYVS
jgi:hypothetical protein